MPVPLPAGTTVIRKTTGRVIVHTSRLVHRLLVTAIGFVVVVSVLLVAAAWRLSQGPIELDWLADRARAILSDDAGPVRVSFGSLMLAWDGFSKGVDYPLDLDITDVDITDAAGRRLAAAPQAHLTFSAAALLLGRFVPRTIEVDHARIAVIRDTDGTIGLGGSCGGDRRGDGGLPCACATSLRIPPETIAGCGRASWTRSGACISAMPK